MTESHRVTYVDLSSSFWPFVDAIIDSRRPGSSVQLRIVADKTLWGSCENIVLWSGTVWNDHREREVFASIITTDSRFHEKMEYYVFESIGEAIAHLYDLYVRAEASVVSSRYTRCTISQRVEKLKSCIDALLGGEINLKSNH